MWLNKISLLSISFSLLSLSLELAFVLNPFCVCCYPLRFLIPMFPFLNCVLPKYGMAPSMIVVPFALNISGSVSKSSYLNTHSLTKPFLSFKKLYIEEQF